jgi:hypothetical protein
VADAPAWLIDWVEAREAKKTAANGQEGGADGGHRLRKEGPDPGSEDLLTCALALMEQHPPAVSGQGGHNTTMTLARHLAWGLNLGERITFDLLSTYYNSRCEPPWSEKELRHKCEDASKQGTFQAPRGYLLAVARGGSAPFSEGEAASAGSTAAGTPPSFALIPCSKLRLVPEDALWSWAGYLATGTVTLLSAYMKAGKTTLFAHLLAALETGGPFLGQTAKPCRVLYVTEEAETRWAARRDKLGLSDHVTFIVRPFRAKPNRAQWSAFLDYVRQVQEREQYDVIIFDTISNLWPVRDENNAVDVQEALMPLHSAIGNAALVLVHHLRKSDGGEGTASRGSGALLAWVDIIVELRRYDPADVKCTRRVLTGYGRYDQTPTQLVIDLKDGQYVAEGDRSVVRVEEIARTVREVLPQGPTGWTIEEILKNWSGERGPRRADLLAALKTGLERKWWVCTGNGVRGNPHRYSVPQGQEPNSAGPGSDGAGSNCETDGSVRITSFEGFGCGSRPGAPPRREPHLESSAAQNKSATDEYGQTEDSASGSGNCGEPNGAESQQLPGTSAETFPPPEEPDDPVAEPGREVGEI